MFTTHSCLSVWTLGDYSLLTVVSAVDVVTCHLPKEVKKNPKKLLKSTVFFEINKMFL